MYETFFFYFTISSLYLSLIIIVNFDFIQNLCFKWFSMWSCKFSLFQVILVSIIVLLSCMIFALLYSLSALKTRYIIKEPAYISEEQNALIKHNVNLSKMYLPFTKFTNKSHNFQAISQHLNNK